MATQNMSEASGGEQSQSNWPMQRLDGAAHGGCLRVVVTGDDRGLSSLIEPLLGSEVFEVSLAEAGGLGEEIVRLPPHVVLVNIIELDAAKPLCVQQSRKRFHRPVVCVVPHPTPDRVEDVVALGADDYLFPPFSTGEVESRVRLLLWREQLSKVGRSDGRRRGVEDSARESGRRVQQRPRVEISERERVVYCCGEALHLPPKQFGLLCLLASDPGRVFTHQEIVAALWSPKRRVTLADLQQHVYALRRNIEPVPGCPRHILTVPGFGYRYVE